APCGICRQVLFEFAGDLLIVLVAEDARGKITSRRRARLRALLPSAFRLAVDRPATGRSLVSRAKLERRA
ncbi:MAG TPA: hypothetical protein VEK07_14900, partial [Polyangiaceae bacterium]|nr:hypothetical protein [Polyangiaceae bacterium]